MRDIKFRAWEEKSNYMLTWRELKNQQLDLSSIKNYSIFEDNSLELMQYTGLKDRNGKEIYEGDCVKDDEDTIFQIKWDKRETKAGFKLYLEFTEKQHLKRSKYLEFDSWLSPDNYLEVIGNIYENPELLEVKDE